MGGRELKGKVPAPAFLVLSSRECTGIPQRLLLKNEVISIRSTAKHTRVMLQSEGSHAAYWMPYFHNT